MKWKYISGLCCIDSTEQQIPRPAEDKDRRKMYYSGKKKKRHTIKNQLMMVNNRGIIILTKQIIRKDRHDYIFKNIKRSSCNSKRCRKCI